jgi:hypothetical protein
VGSLPLPATLCPPWNAARRPCDLGLLPLTIEALLAPIRRPCAGESPNTTYAHEDIKRQIIHLRTQQGPTTRPSLPPRERASDASKDTVIAALRVRAAKLRRENEELRTQLEVAYGLLYGRAGTVEPDHE